jgi:hypothetical protein
MDFAGGTRIWVCFKDGDFEQPSFATASDAGAGAGLEEPAMVYGYGVMDANSPRLLAAAVLLTSHIMSGHEDFRLHSLF